MEGKRRNNPVLIGGLIILVLVVAYAVFKYTKKSEIRQNDLNSLVASSYLYKDGDYKAVGTYFSPGGEENIEVTLTLRDDMIVDSNVKSMATLPGSMMMQKVFIENYKTQVVGKKINDLVLDKVSGSSLTPKGWNDAIARIKLNAKI